MSAAVRAATAADAAAIAAIHNEGIEDRIATFETRPRRPEEVAAQLAAGRPTLVAERDGAVAGWAAILPYSEREAYAGVGEATLYVARTARGRGVGGALLAALLALAEEDGGHKLVGRILTSNAASIALAHRAGFRDVGVHRRHARLDDEWKDVLLVERLLGTAALT